MKKILTIAGYDPSSGAGITRDLDVSFSLGLHGLSAITAIVVQGPSGVSSLSPIGSDVFTNMLDAVGSDVTIDGVKIGVVWGEPAGKAIASFLSARRGVPVVIDPITHAKNGAPLVTAEGLSFLITGLFPLASVVTPNITEASAMTHMKITCLEDMKEAARVLRSMGPGAVIVKGGHLEGAPTDLLFDGEEFLVHTKERVDRTVHGTGCMFSASLASFLTLGYSLREAFYASQEFMTTMLSRSYRINDKGYYYSSSAVLAHGEGEAFRRMPLGAY
jgi:hydroxymethylpyrimidine kinase/phosphomethylpyrimidine kinase